jgi:Family of unknown function (DUF5989)
MEQFDSVQSLTESEQLLEGATNPSFAGGVWSFLVESKKWWLLPPILLLLLLGALLVLGQTAAAPFIYTLF